MANDLELTLACGDYESMRGMIEGTTKPDGLRLRTLTRMDTSTRNWRFLRNGEFDICEMSSSSYMIARDQGWEIDAIPVFPHRRFRHGFVFINTSKGIREPKDLIGRKVGCKSYQVSAILWLRGILEHEYGVPHKSIEWYTELDEDVEFEAPADLKLTKLPDDKSVEKMLVEGEIDALLHPDLIEPLRKGDPRIGRLWKDYKAEEIAYFKRTQIFPIMHIVCIRREIIKQHPWVPVELFRAFEASKALSNRRMENPRVAPIVWYREAWEEQQALIGPDPWEYGWTERNRRNFDTLIGYSHEQGLIKQRFQIEDLFTPIDQGRKRGIERM